LVVRRGGGDAQQGGVGGVLPHFRSKKGTNGDFGKKKFYSRSSLYEKKSVMAHLEIFRPPLSKYSQLRLLLTSLLS